MGRARAIDLFEKFKEALKGLPLQKILQISMDGPNVNWAFIKLLKTELWNIPGFPQFLETGCCGIHVAHGAFLTGHSKASWKVPNILSAGYYLLHDSPARRAEFSHITGLSIYPAKFCRTRWLENSTVASRFLKLFDGLKKYIDKAEKKHPELSSWATLEEAFKDIFTQPKISFFITIADELEPYLTKFQSPKPLAPYLFEETYSVLYNLMERFVKREVLEGLKPSAIAELDLKDSNNLMVAKDVKIGFGARSYLKKLKQNNGATERQILQFRQECLVFLLNTSLKIQERSPLKYPVVQYISCLCPEKIVSEPKTAQTRMSNLLMTLLEKKQISEICAEKSRKQFG